MQVVVGRIGRAHGVRGEVAVEIRTDDPDRRFAPGTVLPTDPPARGPLVVVAARPHSGRLLVRFEGVDSRDAAEALRGTLLVIDHADAGDPGADAWWDADLVGLSAVTVGGRLLGTVTDVIHLPGSELLAVRRADGDGAGELLVPFVRAIVPEVDVAAGRMLVDPPDGLLELADEGDR